ncbi:MAG: DMT family transporter [Cyanobacteria bacterium SIG31]|nr:DMT family transporter [Cyanobacteria bacterium SIG31]
MLSLIFGILIRIFSNSYLNVFQKLLTKKGEFSSVVNLYTYLGLTIIGLIICPKPVYAQEMIPYIFTMGFLGALGNYFIVKALSCGELSTLAPINSYKPIVALLFGLIILHEIPGFREIVGIILILLGTLFLGGSKILFNKSTLYRFIALFLLGTEAIFIKKVILLSNINSTFLYWVSTGLIFALIFALISKHPIKVQKQNIPIQLALILAVALMQYTTNYVFSKINVAYALALFQLSSIVSVFLGVNIFEEKGLTKKLIASFIMLLGATIIILT